MKPCGMDLSTASRVLRSGSLWSGVRAVWNGLGARRIRQHGAGGRHPGSYHRTERCTPKVSVVRSWNAKTPAGFLFAAKVLQEITHRRVLKDCHEKFEVFLTPMKALGEKLGPCYFQFGKLDRSDFRSPDDFLARLIPFLRKRPKEHKFAVEIRNKAWLLPKLVDVLREHGVALAFMDQGWMPRPWEMKDKFDLITSDFTYVRWLGDRKVIEEKTTTWDRVIV